MAIVSPAPAFRAVQQQGETLFSVLGTGMLYAAVTKGVGSLFRVMDDRLAPQEVRRNTLRRESLTVLLTSACGGGIKVLYSEMVKLLQESGPTQFKAFGQKLGRINEPMTVGLICVGTAMAELFSRKIAPRNIWTESDAESSKDKPQQPPDRFNRDDKERSTRPTGRRTHPLALLPPADCPTPTTNHPIRFSHHSAKPNPFPNRADSPNDSKNPYPYRPFRPMTL